MSTKNWQENLLARSRILTGDILRSGGGHESAGGVAVFEGDEEAVRRYILNYARSAIVVISLSTYRASICFVMCFVFLAFGRLYVRKRDVWEWGNSTSAAFGLPSSFHLRAQP